MPFLEDQLGVSAPESLRLSWLRPQDQPLADFAESSGLTVGRHGWSGSPLSIHELTHLVTGGMPVRFFTEGAAVAMEVLGDGRGPRYFSEEAFAYGSVDPRSTMTAIRSQEVQFATAAVFVTYLLVQHGPERFGEFYRRLGGPATMSWIAAQFRDAYGLELEEEIETFLQGVPECGDDSFPLLVAECTGPTIPWQSEGFWRFEGSMDCEDPEVVGGIEPGYAWPSSRAVTVEVPEGGTYFLYINETSDAWLRVGPCFGCPWEDEGIFLDDEVHGKAVQLAAGKHYVRIGSHSDLSPDVTVRLEKW
ncbi:hypothetical protein OV090_36920 [Nannocystis sp. RBIL2]|uniref:hypothetical protein n=1 Tax=Nannocystis sp. RBIL2 TaxID=2996788 RepID=UPI00226F23D2|nr:hypothetical protein [Nannocystis sp. RBIL2]MCY1070385.1 hypothetical protein [Nannocystis sp. RBIL2]